MLFRSTATNGEHRLYGSDGPLWHRGWALDQDEGVEGGLCHRADSVMKKIGVRRLVIGHTPDFEVCSHHLAPALLVTTLLL